MTDRVHVAGERDVIGTLDGGVSDAIVVACPPHPQFGGRRSDSRLRVVSDALVERGLGCLRIDYGPWDEGRGERRDALDALAWAGERAASVGLFGYSFGGSVALVAASDVGESTASDLDRAVAAVSALAPGRTLGDRDVVAALDGVARPVQVVHGERDDTVDAEPVAERAVALGHAVERLPSDHHFVGQRKRAADLVAAFFERSLFADEGSESG